MSTLLSLCSFFLFSTQITSLRMIRETKRDEVAPTHSVDIVIRINVECAN